MRESSKPNIEAAILHLKEFWEHMHAWERKFHALYKQEGTESHAPIARLALDEIYARFLTVRDRKLGRRASAHAGFPTTFDVACEQVLSVDASGNNKALINTLWTHPTVPTMTDKRRYTLVFKSNQWRLDRKERFSSLAQKWVKVVL